MAYAVMIIESNPGHSETLKSHIVKVPGTEVLCVGSGKEAFQSLVSGKTTPPDIIFYDISGDEGALATIRDLQFYKKDIQIIVMTTHLGAEHAIKALDMGVSDFLILPFHPAQMVWTLQNALKRRAAQQEILWLRTWMDNKLTLEDLNFTSPPMQATIYLAQRLAGLDLPLVLEGAAGTGKELLARAIHGSSARHAHPFTRIDFSQISFNHHVPLLFGNGQEPGKLEEAGEGVLFLRGLEHLAAETRDRLAAVINKKTPIAPQSGNYFDGRLVCAVDLPERRRAKREKRREEKFFTAIHALPVTLPTLWEAQEDIPYLADLFCKRYAAAEGKLIHGISPEAMRLLQKLTWPGNTLQLAQAVFHAVMCANGSELQLNDFRYLINADSDAAPYLEETFNEEALSGGGAGIFSCTDRQGNIKSLQEVEQEVILFAMERHKGRMSRVAQCLGIGRSTLYRKLSLREEGFGSEKDYS